MSCTVKNFLKYGLFLFNINCILVGLVLIIYGVVMLAQLGVINELMPTNISIVPIVYLVTGSVVAVISIVGSCGAIRESRCLLVVYATSTLIIAAVNIWLAVVAFNLNESVQEWLYTSFNNQDMLFHDIEKAFICCGTTGPESYTAQNQPLPASCCSFPTDGYCRISYYSGCAELFDLIFGIYGQAMGIIFIIIIIVELVAMLFTVYLMHKMKRKDERYVMKFGFTKRNNI